MFISKEQLKTLIMIEELVYNKLDRDSEEEYTLFCKLNTMIEDLCVQKEKRNKLNTKRIAEKRKVNKYYARPNKEKPQS